jgi:hypothetical protein
MSLIIIGSRLGADLISRSFPIGHGAQEMSSRGSKATPVGADCKGGRKALGGGKCAGGYSRALAIDFWESAVLARTAVVECDRPRINRGPIGRAAKRNL